ncbi:HAD family hydrolase [Streptomyces durbertensis]|uniref:HAD family hydrolase n=1 Tax=Streptomyces durbertensis TaxID=2448886 RepID=A0ABR6EJM8_9ACTN|nr:HAD family hydrolase [Streptomyces durbertensis]MBB1245538.1 HAD family hydrolase [Streptomyces durbertensis]
MIRAIALDIGETLTRDDRHYGSWADWLGVDRHTFSALVGALVSQGRDNTDALRLLRPGIDVEAEYAAREAAGHGERLAEADLYDDVRPALAELQKLGIPVVAAGNQTPIAGRELRALKLPLDAVATSGEWGVAKPAAEFFTRVVGLAGVSDPQHVLYVGDHPQRDVFPANAAGLKTAHLRRGPYGHLWADAPEVRAAADHSVNSLHDLVSIVADS